MKKRKNRSKQVRLSKGVRYSVGMDEVGRGSLAGPVAVAAACVPVKIKFDHKEFGDLRDSKKLSAKQREKWFEYFSSRGGSSSGGKNNPRISYAISRVYPRGIERINISRAANLAALRAYNRLASNLQPLTSNVKVYLDGGLYLGNGKKRIPAKTVVRGDEKIQAIKIASIIAKVSRDAQMCRLAKKYPKYGFDIHKGYGTKAHLAAIKKYGPCEIHRRTFLNL